MNDTPLLVTERFELWLPHSGDVDDLCRLIEDEETRRYLGPTLPEPQPLWDRLMRNAGSWSLYGYGAAYVRRPGHSEIIASCGVFHSWRPFDSRIRDLPEAGWIVRHDWCGQGLAGEVMQAFLAWFDAAHGPKRIVAMIERGNVRSQRLAAKLGFAPFGETREDEAVLDLYERLPD